MDREPCTWAECGEPSVAAVSSSRMDEVWVCARHLDEAIMLDPDREVWLVHDEHEATG